MNIIRISNFMDQFPISIHSTYLSLCVKNNLKLITKPVVREGHFYFESTTMPIEAYACNENTKIMRFT